MKKRTLYLTGIIALIFCACDNIFEQDPTGRAVVFSAIVGDNNLTKTSYSGDVVGGEENGVGGTERIDWIFGDKVTIFMSKEGFDNPWTNSVTPKDYYIKGIHQGGQGENDTNGDTRESHGSLATVKESDQLVWEKGNYKYEFYSLYPTSSESSNTLTINSTNYWDPNNRVIATFSIPKDQSGILSENMIHAYMAAASTQDYYTAEEQGKKSVELRYYPMVTTLFLTLTNKNPFEDDITLTKVSLVSHDVNWQSSPITGKYSATLSGRKFVTDGSDNDKSGEKQIILSFGEQGKTLRYNESIDVALFLRPRVLYTENLNLYIKTNEQGLMSGSLGENISGVARLNPCEKYNLKIDLTGKTWERPEITENLAELLLMFLRFGNNDGGGNVVYPLFQDYFYEYFGYASQDAFNYFWNKFVDEIQNVPFGGMVDYLKSLFPGDKLDGFIDALSTIKKLDINTGGITSSGITAKDFRIFKNVEEIELFHPGDDTVTFKISDLDFLDKFTIHNGSHGKIIIEITDCPTLTTIDLSSADNVEEFDVTVTECPEFTTLKSNGYSIINDYVDKSTCPKYNS